MINKKILCVDDESNVLDGIKRLMKGNDYEIEIALSGHEALELLENCGPYAVLATDMRMPQMDGIELLSYAKRLAPDTVRIMLTGNADRETAVKAVNEGNVFRFLNKPCKRDDLINTFASAIEVYRLRQAEIELLEGTLRRSLQVLVDVLAIVNPTAFSKSNRIKRLAKDTAMEFGYSLIWEIETAAMLSQIGCVSVPEGILEKVNSGEKLTDREEELYRMHPEVGGELLSQIPRLETVAKIVANQYSVKEDKNLDLSEDELAGARILNMALDYDRAATVESTSDKVIDKLSDGSTEGDKEFVDALSQAVDHNTSEFEIRNVEVNFLEDGMILNESIKSKSGMLVLSEGQEVTQSIILRLRGFVDAGSIDSSIAVRVPKE